MTLPSYISVIASSLDETFIVLIYGLAFYNVFKILRDHSNPTSATAWILVNLSFPLIGVPVYYFLGQSRLKSYLKRRQRTRQELSHYREVKEFQKLVTDPKSLAPHQEASWISQSPTNNHIDILDTGTRVFDEIFTAVAEAKSFILIQYYILRPDVLGQKFKKLLIERAEAGVAIFLIFDNLGSVGLTNKYIRDLKRHGIQVARFLPFTLRFNLQINFRNHRKLVLVDGEVAFVGGMNVGEEYLGRRRLWRDTQLKIVGPAILKLAETFIDDWNFAVSEDRHHLPSQHIYKAHPKENGEVPTRVISFGPGDEIEIGLFMFMHCIMSATKKIVLATPYFIPDTTLERCLMLAIQRGVEVCLIVPKKADHWYIKPVSRPYARRLAEAGGKVYLYHKGFMHQKVMLIDDETAIIGTSNFDNRSIYLNFETCIVTQSKEFGKKVATMLRKDIEDAEPLDAKSRESKLWLLASNLMRLLAPLF